MTEQTEWRKHFPLKEPRADQAKALDWIISQFKLGHRRIVAELGTGIGKSAIAITVGGWLEERESGVGDFSPGVTVLTSQKVLQDQYIKDFAKARDLRSAANFTCNGPVGGSCGETSRVKKAVGPILAKEITKCSACPYRTAKDDFVASHIGITNYSYFLSEGTYAGELPPRRLLVLDEAHNVEDEVRRWTSVEVSEYDADELGLSLPKGEGPGTVSWLDDKYKAAIMVKLGFVGGKLKKIVRDGDLTEKSVKKLANDNDRLDKRMCQINRLLEKGGKLLISHQQSPDGKRSIRFQPIDVTALVVETLYSRSSASLLMSATLLNRKVFTEAVGLPKAPYLSIPSPFKDEAFGLTFRPVGKMTRDHIEVTLRDFPRAVKRILDEHPNDKGIIHTTNYRITRAIGDGVKDHRLLVQAAAADRDAMLKKHRESPDPTVLVSPSMMEGLDLRDDLGRFQIMCKVPYPDMSDPIVKHKDRSWYGWRTVRSLVQAIGRGVRSETDWTKTYILDLAFMDLIERSGDMMPSHLVKNINVEDPFQ